MCGLCNKNLSRLIQKIICLCFWGFVLENIYIGKTGCEFSNISDDCFHDNRKHECFNICFLSYSSLRPICRWSDTCLLDLVKEGGRDRKCNFLAWSTLLFSARIPCQVTLSSSLQPQSSISLSPFSHLSGFTFWDVRTATHFVWRELCRENCDGRFLYFEKKKPVKVSRFRGEKEICVERKWQWILCLHRTILRGQFRLITSI